ncbi:ComF family protein [Bordetella genomosp. 13]|uniref:ComF family protein n=1 Tax=Bordetella genomosp. 13 TaxID=463040 RepID=UPI0021B5104C|nr:ComF family protein [Bordetella genomosp. 13]
MPPIIAHPPVHALRRAIRAWGLAWRRLAARAGSACPACGGAARGGRLCEPCVEDVLEGVLDPDGLRCQRCALRLSCAALPRDLPAGAVLCVDCLLHPPAFARTVAAFDYEPPFDGLVQRYKGEHRYVMAGALAHLLYCAWLAADVEGPPVQALVPVPASRSSLRRRGFNTAAELAAALGAQANVPVLRTALHRRREDGRRQASLGRRQREAAVQGLYACRRPLPPLHVGLVDDVMTTGSTVDAAARALLGAGAARVTVLVAARTPALPSRD